MKKLMTLMAAVALTFGAVTVFAQPDAPAKKSTKAPVKKSTKTPKKSTKV
jgi:hypothetical protein